MPEGDNAVKYRINREAAMSLTILSGMADFVNAIPFINMITGPSLQGLIALYFTLHKVNPVVARSIATQKNTKSKIKKPNPKITRRVKLLGRMGRFVVTIVLESVPFASIMPWTSINTALTIKESREEDEREAENKQFDNEAAEEFALAQKKLRDEEAQAALLDRIQAQETLNALTYTEELKRLTETQAGRREYMALRELAFKNPEEARTALAGIDPSLVRRGGNTLDQGLRDTPRVPGGELGGAKSTDGVRVMSPEELQNLEQTRGALEDARAAVEANTLEDLPTDTVANFFDDASAVKNLGNAREMRRMRNLTNEEFLSIANATSPMSDAGRAELLATVQKLDAEVSRDMYTNAITRNALMAIDDKRAALNEAAALYNAMDLAETYADTLALKTAVANSVQALQGTQAFTNLPSLNINELLTVTVDHVDKARRKPISWQPIADQNMKKAFDQVLAEMKRAKLGGEVTMNMNVGGKLPGTS